MNAETYTYYVNKTKKDFKDLLDKTQNQLSKSKSKGEDFYILNIFWDKFCKKAVQKWTDTSTLFLDSGAMNPMPESVSKQFVTMLFDIKNINLLTDVDIYEGLESAEYYSGSTKKEIVKSYNDYFSKEVFA